MTLQEAKQTIRHDAGGFSEWVYAAGVLTSSRESSLADLLACLKRKGLPAEMAATTLYVRTKRPREDDSIHSIVLDHDDWSKWLGSQSQERRRFTGLDTKR
jgi:asparagine synthetase A